jgi:predicted DNA-binding transcriptional regulator AlpA
LHRSIFFWQLFLVIIMTNQNKLAFVKLTQIIGNKKAKPPIQALLPVSRSSFLNGVKEGRYPAPYKIGLRGVAWKLAEIEALLENLGAR